MSQMSNTSPSSPMAQTDGTAPQQGAAQVTGAPDVAHLSSFMSNGQFAPAPARVTRAVNIFTDARPAADGGFRVHLGVVIDGVRTDFHSVKNFTNFAQCNAAALSVASDYRRDPNLLTQQAQFWFKQTPTVAGARGGPQARIVSAAAALA